MRWKMFVTFATVCAIRSQIYGQMDIPYVESVRQHSATVRHIEPKGIGYDKGYTTLELLLAPHNEWSCFVPLFNVRGHVFNDGKWAANAGVGGRYIFDPVILGGNIFYDFRDGPRKRFQQWGAGVELLTRMWEFRANGYLTYGKKASRFYNVRFDHFEGNNIILGSKRNTALQGFDAEAGVNWPITRHSNWYFGAGPYYLDGQFGKHSWGGQARLTGTIVDYLRLTVSASHDSLFKTIVQGEVGITIPFGKRDCVPSCRFVCPYLLEDRLYQPIVRKEIIPVKKTRLLDPAINPATGLPWIVWFVNNNSSSLGTFESPFPTLAQAQAASQTDQIIYVFPGNATYNEGIVLKDRQLFYGSGIAHTIPTTRGPVTIPPFSKRPPLISNPAGDTVVLANRNEVSGFHIIPGAGFVGILGSGITDSSINNNIISNQPATRMMFDGVHGLIFINDNLLSTEGGTSPFGIRIGGATSANFTIRDNLIFNNDQGISLASTAPGNRLNIFHNAIADITFNALQITPSGGGHLFVQFSNNQVGVVGRCIHVIAALDNEEFDLIVNDNEINASANIMAMSPESGRTNIIFTRNAAVSDGPAFAGGVFSDGILTLEVSANAIAVLGDTILGGSPFLLLAENTSHATYCVTNNLLFFLTGFASQFDSADDATVCLKYQNNKANHFEDTVVEANQSGTGPFYLEPFVGNDGGLATTGTITRIPNGGCGCQ